MALANKSITLSFLDITLLKWSSVLFGMILGAMVHEFVNNNIWLFLFLVLLLAGKPTYTYLMRNKDK